MLRSYRYEEIAEDLRQQIRLGKFAVGQRLPAERVLMQHYEVQRNTLRQALTLLQQEKWLQVRPRSGVFVATPPDSSAPPQPLPATETPISSGVVLVINAWNRVSTALDNTLIGLAQALENTPLSVQRFNSTPPPGGGSHIMPSMEYLTANNVVGAILWAQNPTDLSALTQLRAAVPLVLIDRRVLGFEADCVHFDDVSGGRMVTEHLIAQGHQRIGFLAGEAFAETVQQRWRGYTLALEAAGIPVVGHRAALFQGLEDKHFADLAGLFLEGHGQPLTAVVCSNDSAALLLLRFLRTAGKRVPEDIAVTGYGNLLPDYLDTLDLTTVAQPFHMVGRAAGELIRERIRQRESGPIHDSYRDVVLPVHLIVRNSSQTHPHLRKT